MGRRHYSAGIPGKGVGPGTFGFVRRSPFTVTTQIEFDVQASARNTGAGTVTFRGRYVLWYAAVYATVANTTMNGTVTVDGARLATVNGSAASIAAGDGIILIGPSITGPVYCERELIITGSGDAGTGIVWVADELEDL